MGLGMFRLVGFLVAQTGALLPKRVKHFLFLNKAARYFNSKI